MKRHESTKKGQVQKGHEYHVDGLGTMGFIFGLACLGIILYSVIQVVFS
jgi:hypothetical protein